MKYSLWGSLGRAIMLLVVLIIVVFAMRHLKNGGVNKDLFFFNEQVAPEVKKTMELVPFDLCSTRVESVYLKWNEKEYNLKIDGKTWNVTEGAKVKLLPSVDMEKWLVLLCRVKPERIINLEQSKQKFTFPEILTFHYVDGQEIQFNLEAQAFKYKEHGFYSKSFLEMVNNLKTMVLRQ